MRKRWAGHVARNWEKKYVYRIVIGNPEEKSHSGDIVVGRMIILKFILKT
jgi:hypothetical protein